MVGWYDGRMVGAPGRAPDEPLAAARTRVVQRCRAAVRVGEVSIDGDTRRRATYPRWPDAQRKEGELQSGEADEHAERVQGEAHLQWAEIEVDSGEPADGTAEHRAAIELEAQQVDLGLISA